MQRQKLRPLKKPEFAVKVKELLALLEKEQKANGDTLPLSVAEPKSGDWTPPKKGPPKAKDKKDNLQ